MKIKQLHEFENGAVKDIAPVTIPEAVVNPDTQENLADALGRIEGSVPTKVSELENDKGYLTSHQDISGKLDSSVAAATYATKDEVSTGLNDKVDKVEGKQLSSEDFTSALKSKLESLGNYDDTTISQALEDLRSDFDELVSGDTTTAIKSFNEIVAFLEGIEDSQDLDSIIAGINTEIAKKLDKTGGTIDGNLTVNGTFNTTGNANVGGTLTVGGATTTNGMLTAKEQITAEKGISSLGSINTANSIYVGTGQSHVKVGYNDYAGFDKPNNVHVSTWYGFSVGTTQGTNGDKPVFYVDARTGATGITGLLTANGGMSVKGNLFMNPGGEGIYLSSAGISWHGANNGWVASNLTFAKDGYVGVGGGFNVAGNASINGSLNIGGNKAWHAGNDGSGSGLDADLLDGNHIGELSRSIFKRTVTFSLESTDDLNDLTFSNDKLGYYTTADNTSYANAPYTNFGLWAFSLNTEYTGQLAFPYALNGNISYRRTYHAGNSGIVWSDWKQIAFTDGTIEKANKLSTPRKLWGRSFDGSGDVSGAITGATTGDFSSLIYNNLAHYVYDGSDRANRLSMTWTGGKACVYSINNNEGNTYNDLYIGDAAGALTYKASNRFIGIGTTSPAYKLDVNGTGCFRDTSYQQKMVTLGSGIGIHSRKDSSTEGSAQGVTAFGYSGTNLGSMSGAMVAGDTLEYFYYGKAYNNSPLNIYPSGNISVGGLSDTNTLSVLGTLSVSGATTLNGRLNMIIPGVEFESRYDIGDQALSHHRTDNGGYILYAGLQNGEAARFETFDKTGGWVANGWVLFQNGNMSIGYTSDTGYKLHVNGNAYIKNLLTANGGIAVTGTLTVGGKSVLVSGGLTKSDVTTALGYTPEYISGLSVSGDNINLASKAGTVTNTKTATVPGLSKIPRFESYTTATTVASLNVDYRSIYVTLSANASLSASGTGATYNGRSITAYVYTAAARTITIPTTGNYVSMCGSSYTTKAGGWVEFNLTCINGKWHIAMLEQQ